MRVCVHVVCSCCLCVLVFMLPACDHVVAYVCLCSCCVSACCMCLCSCCVSACCMCLCSCCVSACCMCLCSCCVSACCMCLCSCCVSACCMCLCCMNRGKHRVCELLYLHVWGTLRVFSICDPKLVTKMGHKSENSDFEWFCPFIVLLCKQRGRDRH